MIAFIILWFAIGGTYFMGWLEIETIIPGYKDLAAYQITTA